MRSKDFHPCPRADETQSYHSLVALGHIDWVHDYLAKVSGLQVGTQQFSLTMMMHRCPGDLCIEVIAGILPRDRIL
ncbi:MAG: hypothetical protein DI498_06875 [Paracoccus denitrificans]|nr:MAG: hypothetical protein DI498_06875 [Paracoccus denitrificans]PZO84801.1 MAG: hypothetical protein DI633_06875 [Paracoccus denitrificans]